MSIETLTPNAVQVVLKEKFVHMYFDATTRILYVKWIGFLRLDDVKKACGVLLNFIRANKVTLNFNDQTELKVLSNDVQQYLASQLLPEAERAGLRKIGVLLAGDVFAQASVSNVNAKVSLGGLSMATFGSQKLCTQWLLE